MAGQRDGVTDRTPPLGATRPDAAPPTGGTADAWDAGIDFRAVFEAAPGVQLVLAPDAPHFTMLAASDERLAATLTSRERTIGRPLFDVFADANPGNPEPSGVANLRASLETVLRTGRPHRMAVQRYDLQRPDGAREVRYWAPQNVPVLGPDGAVRCIVHHVRDVTDLVLEREAAAAAERREAELRAILDAMRDGVFLGSADGITLVNHAALDQAGLSRPEDFPRDVGTLVARLHLRDADTGADVPAAEHPFVRALAGERAERDLLVRPDGADDDRVVRCVAAPVVVEGAPVAAVAVTTDITVEARARRRTEAALVDSDRARTAAEAARARSEAVLESIADAFYLLDREWRFIYVNDAAEPLLHTTREALLGRTLWEAFPGVVGSPFEGPYREAMATGRVTSAEAYFEPLGTWFDVRTYPWSGGLMVHFRDVGARKAGEAERERLLRTIEIERSRLEEVFRRAPSFIVAFRGPDHVYEFVNEAYYQVIGHRDVVGLPLLEAVPEVRGQGYKELLDRVLATGEPWVGREAPVALQRTPGAPLETRYLDLVFQAFAEADGTRTGVIVHGSDVTEQVLARREVERLLGVSEEARAEAEAARREAEVANRAKSEFLAVMSHELRTPLNAISGYAELIEMGLHGPVSTEQRAALDRIQRSQRALLSVINEVLNFARLETGVVTYKLADVPVADAVAAAEILIAPQLRAKGLEFHWEGCAPGLAVRADRDKLQQVLLNLLSNAIKFTHGRDDAPGRIVVSCAVVADGRSVELRVRDTGVGIPADKLESIFEPFVQVDQRLTREYSGTGLGLAISRELARGMGGEIRAESEVGAGATFILSLCAVDPAQ